jgi:predicted tellurium resistance membrane protein TerC
MHWLTDPNALVGLATLTALELVLGIDNIIFISILAGRLPVAQQAKARRLGLTLALGSRILLLLSISWIMGLSAPLFSVAEHAFTGRDLILIAGGLFLIGKATFEIHSKLEGAEHGHSAPALATMGAVLRADPAGRRGVLGGLGDHRRGHGRRGGHHDRGQRHRAGRDAAGGRAHRGLRGPHPTVKVLALAFLVMIGGNLFVEGFGYHVPKGYTYFAMAFALGVEFLNIRLRRKAAPVKLHGPELPTS